MPNSLQNKKIYVSIACYRDPYLQSTIDDLFSKADNPENITVGCFVQERAEEAPLIKDTHDGKVVFISQEPGQIFSVCVCRNIAMSMRTDEFFVLQIDSHMRFDEHWDSYLIGLYESTKNEKSLISTYAPDWWEYSDYCEKKTPRKNTIAYFTFDTDESKEKFFKHYEFVPMPGKSVSEESEPYRLGWYLCGHLIFGPYSFFTEIPQPSWVGFWGEEVINSLRAFTAGWDVFIPANPPVYHLNAYLSKGAERPHLWNDYPFEHSDMRVTTTNKIIDILRNKTVGQDELFDKRDLDELYTLIGYNLSKMFSEWSTQVTWNT